MSESGIMTWALRTVGVQAATEKETRLIYG